MLSNFNHFNFSQPLWLWGLIILPFIWIAYALMQKISYKHTLESFIDKHLLPHLLLSQKTIKKAILAPFILSLIWIFSILAMMGPRWDYHDIDTFKSNSSLIVLLDLSKSMDAEDVKPSRLKRANQELADIISQAHNINIGIIAFAAIPHIIAPLTDDMETLKHLLPSLSTDLIAIQGSNIQDAINLGEQLLKAEKGKNKSLLIISDGDFEDTHFNIKTGINIHVLGVGTPEGSPIPNGTQGWIKAEGKTVISKLGAKKLKQIAHKGKGLYTEATFSNEDTYALLKNISKTHDIEKRKKGKIRQWHERFYLLIFPIMFLLLFLRQRGFLIISLCLYSVIPINVYAFEWQRLFQNTEQQAAQALTQKEYNKASQKFTDAYRRGVAQYKAGQYNAAEKSFTQSQRKNVQENAKYNLGNSQLKQGKITQAIKQYEDILKENPQHIEAKQNLEIAKKMLKQQQKSEQKKSQNPVNSANKQTGKKEKRKKEEKNKQTSSSNKNKPQQSNKQAQQAQQPQRTQKDVNADRWLNRIKNNQKGLLKNQFLIKEQQYKTPKGGHPW